MLLTDDTGMSGRGKFNDRRRRLNVLKNVKIIVFIMTI
jgi:hypothetical protein